MSVSENILNRSLAGGPSTSLTAHASIENPGWMVTYHPKPDEYEQSDWFHMIKCLYTSNGCVIKDVLAAVEYYDDGPYPLKSRQKSWGVEVTWSTR